jgi:hypothetical protein
LKMMRKTRKFPVKMRREMKMRIFGSDSEDEQQQQQHCCCCQT